MLIKEPVFYTEEKFLFSRKFYTFSTLAVDGSVASNHMLFLFVVVVNVGVVVVVVVVLLQHLNR